MPMEKMDTNPVFLKQKDIPDSENNRPSVLEVCRSAERISGQGTILGAQLIRELWRIYPASKVARDELLLKRLTLRATSISLRGTNPYVVREDTGEERMTTKVWIDDLPMSASDEELEQALVKEGCELRSRIIPDRARDANNKLTRFLTGRRFVFISIPETPLPKTLTVNIFKVKIFHKEQKTTQKLVCSNCLETDHHRSACTKEVVCRACKETGHKQGDEICALPRPEPPARSNRESGSMRRSDSANRRQDQKTGTNSQQTGANSQQTSQKTEKSGKEKTKKQAISRNRPLARQTTISATMELERQHPRSRSVTPKRQRSRELQTEGNAEKQARQDGTTDDDTDTETQSVWD